MERKKVWTKKEMRTILKTCNERRDIDNHIRCTLCGAYQGRDGNQCGLTSITPIGWEDTDTPDKLEAMVNKLYDKQDDKVALAILDIMEAEDEASR